ncbi:ATP-binding protein [Streptomyces sp. NPDC096132]|uniref:ATP-binding protein n=1 Tax=Streptomyces sp. NPDC096132 TaxID=3366075 RepID=UPI003827D6BF
MRRNPHRHVRPRPVLGLLTDSYDVEAAPRALVTRLPAPVTRAVGRVVQEALTNVVRHARPALAVIEVEVDGEIRLKVADDGQQGRQRPGGGRGLATMKEPAADGGWLVTATIPWRGTA